MERGREILADLPCDLSGGSFIVDMGGDISGRDDCVSYIGIVDHASGIGLLQHGAGQDSGENDTLILQVFAE